VLSTQPFHIQQEVLQPRKFIGRQIVRDAHTAITIECEAIRGRQVSGQSLSPPPGKPVSNTDASRMKP
jgi:hypothetical protein